MRRGRPSVLEKHALSTGSGMPLEVGRALAVMMDQRHLTYGTARDCLCSIYDLQANTVAKYYAHYKKVVRSRALREKRTEFEVFHEIQQEQDDLRQLEFLENTRDEMSYSVQAPQAGWTAEAIKKALLKIAAEEDARIKKYSQPQKQFLEPLIITIRYRSATKKIRHR